MRCGGSVRFKNWKSVTADYNAIPIGSPGQYKVEEIRAVKACIIADGLAHLSKFSRDALNPMKVSPSDGLTDLKKIHWEKCDQLGDGMF